MGWMDLVDDHRVFLIRLTPDLWEEIQHGALKSADLLRPGRTERVPEFRYGDVLLLYHPELPDRPPPELSHVVTVRSELSNDTGYGLGLLYRMVPPIGRERLLYASQRGALPEVFRRLEDRVFASGLLTTEQRDRFLEYALNSGIVLQVEEGKGRSPVVPPVGESTVIVEYEW